MDKHDIEKIVSDLQARSLQVEKTAAAINERVTAAEREIILFRDAKHNHGNFINSHEREINKIERDQEKIQGSMETLKKFQYFILGATTVGASTELMSIVKYLAGLINGN